MNFNLEKKLRKQGYQIIIGVDEAGRGPLAGPVVACAVNLKCHPELVSGSNNNEMLKQVQHDKLWNLIRDSKKLSEKQREMLFDFIRENFYVGVGMCDHKIIDRINILQASLLAMKKAVIDLLKNLKRSDLSRPQRPKEVGPLSFSIILVDGNKIISGLKMEQRAIVGGDRKVKSIAAASIIAKVTRDRLMLKMHQKFPHYGFDKHKGYGTKIHLQSLKKYGPSAIHRLSFRPVKK
jgi:ribonuclease HII